MENQPKKPAEFQPGDVVRLKSGGPDMTVASLAADVAVCVWYRVLADEYEKAEFRTLLLEEAEIIIIHHRQQA